MLTLKEGHFKDLIKKLSKQLHNAKQSYGCIVFKKSTTEKENIYDYLFVGNIDEHPTKPHLQVTLNNENKLKNISLYNIKIVEEIKDIPYCSEELTIHIRECHLSTIKFFNLESLSIYITDSHFDCLFLRKLAKLKLNISNPFYERPIGSIVLNKIPSASLNISNSHLQNLRIKLCGLETGKIHHSTIDIFKIIKSAIITENSFNIKNHKENLPSKIYLQSLNGHKNSLITFDTVTPPSMVHILGNTPNVSIKNSDLSSFNINIEDISLIELDDSNTFHIDRHKFFEILPNYEVLTLYNNALPQKEVTKRKSKKYFESRIQKFVLHKNRAKNIGYKRLEDDMMVGQLTWERFKDRNFINYAYYLTCGYGKSFIQPLITFIIFLMFFSLIYYFFLPIEFSPFYLSAEASIPHINLPEQLHLLDENKILAGWQKGLIILLVYFQKAIQLFLLIESGMAIRNAVKK